MLIFQGRRHFYEGTGWTPIALPIYVLKQMGVESVLLTNAAGGVRDGMKPGDLMILSDHISNFPAHPLIVDHNECWGPRFPDQTAVYDAGRISGFSKTRSSPSGPGRLSPSISTAPRILRSMR